MFLLCRQELDYGARFYPSALDAVRVKLLGGAFQARNGTGAWATVHVLEERPRGSWNSVPLAAPVLAQEVRFLGAASEDWARTGRLDWVVTLR